MPIIPLIPNLYPAYSVAAQRFGADKHIGEWTH